MADKKISALTSATTPLAGTEVLPIVQGGATVKVTVDNLTAGKTVSMSNLTFTGTGNRITGDFSNGTESNRVLVQTSTTDGATNFGIIPNGTGAGAIYRAYNNSSAANSARAVFGFVGGTSELGVRSEITGTGTYLPMTFHTGGSERVRVDTSGNVGIGTTTSLSRLTSLGTSSTVANGASTRNPVASLRGGNDNNRLDVYVDNSGATSIMGLGAYNTSGGNTALALYTGPSVTEAMRIDSSGRVLIAATGTEAYFDANLNVNQPSASGVTMSTKQSSGTASQISVVNWHTATTGDNQFIAFGTEASFTQRGSISYNRAGGLTAYNTTSDYRAKDISGPVTGSGALIDSVPVYMGKIKDATQERPMFIAHETPAYAHTGVKDAVDADGKPVFQQMDASALIPVMWAEIQDLRKRLAAAGI